jgi:hypothetical protein
MQIGMVGLGRMGANMVRRLLQGSMSRHHAIFDAVMDHLDEVPGTVWAAVQISGLGGAVNLLGRTWYIAWAARESLEDRIDVFHDFRFTSDHHAIASFQPPYAAACPHIPVCP